MYAIKGWKEVCPALIRICIWSFVISLLIMPIEISFFPFCCPFLLMNYVWPKFSRMIYVGGQCRLRSFSYQNFLFLVNNWEGNYVDLIPASTGYLDTTTVRSYSQQDFHSLYNGNWDKISERISKIHLKMDFINKSRLKYQNATGRLDLLGKSQNSKMIFYGESC